MKRTIRQALCALLAIVLIAASLIIPASATDEPAEAAVEVKGYQFSLADGKTKIRFIAGLASDSYTDFGMIIKCVDEYSIPSRFDIKGAAKLDEIKQTKNGTQTSISAEELRSEALYTAVIEGIPADATYFRFEVTPYCTVNGETVNGAKKIIVMDANGVTTLTEYQLADNKDSLKIYGRSIELLTGIACDFSASGIEFNADLRGGDLMLRVDSAGVSYYTLYINGVRQDQRLEFADGIRDYVIAEDLAAGEYNVKLIKQTQAEHSVSTLISLSMNGSFMARPADKELLIEFIGDSITCGYGLVGYPTEGVTNYGGAKFMDATLAYAYKTAEALGADHSLVSLSGWAILPNANGGGCIPAIYQKTSYKRSNIEYEPERAADIVVIHLGTNDFYSRKENYDDFVPESKKFIADVKEMHPGAKIIWVYGSMMSGSNLSKFENTVHSIINDLGGEASGLYSVKVPQSSSGTNNSHPTPEAQARSAEILAEFIRNNVLD